MGSFLLFLFSFFMAFISLDLAFNFLFDRRFWGVFFFPVIWFQDFVRHRIKMGLAIWEKFYPCWLDGQFQRFSLGLPPLEQNFHR